MKKDKIQLQKTKEYEIRASYTDEVSELEKRTGFLRKRLRQRGLFYLRMTEFCHYILMILKSHYMEMGHGGQFMAEPDLGRSIPGSR